MAPPDEGTVEVNLNEEENKPPEKKPANGEAKEPVVEIVEKEEDAGEEISADDAVADLNKQLEAQKSRTRQESARADKNAKTAHQAVETVDATNLMLINSTIDNFKVTQEQLTRDLAMANAAGDSDNVAQLTAAMTTNAARLLQLENGKQALETRPKRAAPEASESDPVEALAAQLQRPSADWIRAHPEYATDPRLHKKMIAAHHLVTADDVPTDTPEYFAAVEKILGIGAAKAASKFEKVEEEAVSEAAKPVKKRSSPAGAPVSRSGTGSGADSGRVTLTKAEAEAADASGISRKQYYLNKMALQKEGRLPN